jgi:hypothetical protein
MVARDAGRSCFTTGYGVRDELRGGSSDAGPKKRESGIRKRGSLRVGLVTPLSLARCGGCGGYFGSSSAVSGVFLKKIQKK